MGNENEIKVSKEKFLPREIPDTTLSPQGYSIDKEFRKTKKNKSFSFYFVQIAFLLLLLFSTYALTRFIHKSYESGVGVELIKDIQLKELILESQGVYDNFKLSVQSIESLQKEKKQKLIELGQTYMEEIEELKQKKLPYKKHRTVYRERTRKFQKETRHLKKKYDASIRDKQKEAQKLKRKARQKERLLEQKAAQVKEIVNNYSQLQGLALSQQLLKFNPIIKEKKLKKILKERNQFSIKDSLALSPYPADLGASIGIDKERIDKEEKTSFEKRLSNIKKRDLLMERLLKVPYRNSIPPLLKRLLSLNKEITQSYEKLWQSLHLQLQDREEKLSVLEYALAHHMDTLESDERALAYVLDARDPRNIYLYANKEIQIEGSLKALILGKGKEPIARVEIFRFHSVYRAQLLHLLDEDESIKPFDWLVLEKNEEE